MTAETTTVAGNNDPVLHAEQRAVVAFVVAHPEASVFLTGPAGTGKSLTFRAMATALRRRGTKIGIAASTGRAAIDIDGATLHSWAGLGVELPRTEPEFEALVKRIHNSRAGRRWTETQTLFIDEISMVRADLFNIVDRLGRHLRRKPELPFGGLRLVMVGDFFQLPPVLTDADKARPVLPYVPPGAAAAAASWNGPIVVEILSSNSEEKEDEQEDEEEDIKERPLFAFESEAWRHLRPQTFELTHVWRQHDDPVFLEHLRGIRRGHLTDAARAALESRVILPLPQASADRLITHIMSLNREVDAINARELRQLKGTLMTYAAQDWARDKEPPEAWFKALRAPAVLELRVGAQVMLVKNVPDEGLVNGTVGRVVGFHPGRASGPGTVNECYPYVKFPARGVNNKWPEVTRLMTPLSWEKRDTFDGPLVASRKQVPLILAWAVSSHKAQGQTITCDMVASLGSVFEYGQAYVMLSRVQRLSQLYLESFDPQAIRAHPRVLEAFPQ